MSQRSRRTHWKQALAAPLIVAVSIVGGLGLAELGLRAFWDRSGIPDDLVARVYTFLPPLGGVGGSGCYYRESMVPHPYFGFVYGQRPGCVKGNDSGFSGSKDIPVVRDAGFYSILILGASLAEQFAAWSDSGETGLERILNRDYVSPDGKPFRTLNAAMGGWKTPQSVAVLNFYGDRVDAAISIDGGVEGPALDEPYELSMPEPESYLLAQKSLLDLDLLETLWITKKFIAFASEFSILRNAVLSKVIAQTLLNRLTRGITRDGPGGKNHERLFKFFELPTGWNRDQRHSWNLKEYEKTIRLMKAKSEALGIRYAHFLQPIPGIKKALTEEEKRMRGTTPEEYRDLVALSARMKQEGMPTVDLTDVFEHETGTIYGDGAHPRCDGKGCPGYTLMSERIAKELAQSWHLRPRVPH